MSCNSGGTHQRHATNLSVYPPIPYFQASYHNVTVGVVKNMLFIGTTLSVTNWRIIIQRWRSCMFQDWRCCRPQFFLLFISWLSQVRNYLAGGMMCAAQFSFPMIDLSLSVFLFVKARDALMS